MNLKNYTSTVSVDRSLSQIEHRLVSAGARHIARSYDPDGNLIGIMFQIEVNTLPMTFKLPAKWDVCFKVFMNEVRRPKPTTERTKRDQAQRTAWKILADWVDIQVTLIKLEQAEFIEVFLPYIYDGRKQQTFFERMKESNYKALLPSATA